MAEFPEIGASGTPIELFVAGIRDISAKTQIAIATLVGPQS
jgi:hypothetical protein